MDLSDKINRNRLSWELEYQTNDEIELDNLKAYLNAEEKYGNIDKNLTYQALKLKYEAITKIPTIIEKTMSPAQLYASNNPLWANNYTGDAIERILLQLANKPKTEESFHTALAMIDNYKNNGRMMLDEYGNIGGVHGNLLQVGISKKHKPQKIKNKIL